MKMSRCIGFRKRGDRQNVLITTTTPRNDRLDATRVVISIVRSWADVKAGSGRSGSMVVGARAGFGTRPEKMVW